MKTPFSLTVLMLVSALGPVWGQGTPAPAGAVIVDGPFEYQVGPKILGYVVNRRGTLVDFQPCTGKMVPDVEEILLKETARDCRDGPSSRIESVRCGLDPSESDTKLAAAFPLGTTIELLANPGNRGATLTLAIGSAAPPPDNEWLLWEQVAGAGIAPCADTHAIEIPVSGGMYWIGIVGGNDGSQDR